MGAQGHSCWAPAWGQHAPEHLQSLAVAPWPPKDSSWAVALGYDVQLSLGGGSPSLFLQSDSWHWCHLSGFKVPLSFCCGHLQSWPAGPGWPSLSSEDICLLVLSPAGTAGPRYQAELFTEPEASGASAAPGLQPGLCWPETSEPSATGSQRQNQQGHQPSLLSTQGPWPSTAATSCPATEALRPRRAALG